MLSRSIHNALEREVVGQPRAVHTLTRSLTVSLAGLAPAAAPIGIHLLLGPSGTGKTHTARTLARLLHGEGRGLAVVDCKRLAAGDELASMARQLGPCFQVGAESDEAQRTMLPRAIVLIEHVEAASRELMEALLGLVETGSVVLGEGKHGSFAGSLVLMTSNLCAREIFGEDRKEIGFSGVAADLEESEKARIFQICATAAEKRWGSVLLAHIDDLTVYHRLREPHLPLILDRHLEELNRTLAGRATVELDPEAARFLVRRGGRWPQYGAWYLVKLFRRFVVFPLADLLAGDRRPIARRVYVELEGAERLRFTVREQAQGLPPPSSAPREVPIEWSADRPAQVPVRA